MAHRSKKNGDGAAAQALPTEPRRLPAWRAEPSRRPAWGAEHPTARLRDQIDALFDRFFAAWPAPAERGWAPERG
jgi:hypothetical protein